MRMPQSKRQNTWSSECINFKRLLLTSKPAPIILLPPKYPFHSRFGIIDENISKYTQTFYHIWEVCCKVYIIRRCGHVCTCTRARTDVWLWSVGRLLKGYFYLTQAIQNMCNSSWFLWQMHTKCETLGVLLTQKSTRVKYILYCMSKIAITL